MSYKSKYRLQTHFRKQSIPYTSYSDCLQVGTVSITFFADFERVTFMDNRFPSIQFNTNYSEPSTLVSKLDAFKKMIIKFIARKQVFNIPFHLN